MSNPTGQRPKFSPPTVFIKMGGDGKPMREDGPSAPSHVKILGPRNGGRQQQGGRPVPQQQQNGRSQMNGPSGRRGQQQPQFAPPQQYAQPQLAAMQMTPPQLTLCRTLVHGYLKRGLDDLGDDNLKLAALTLDALDQILGHAAAIAPPPQPRVAPPTPDAIAPRNGRIDAPRAQFAPRLSDADILAEIDAVDAPAERQTGIAPRRVVRAQSSVGMPTGVVLAPMAEPIGSDRDNIDITPDDVGDVSDIFPNG